MRLWFFARELAKRGHQVIQVCQNLDCNQLPFSPEDLSLRLSDHDWSEPFVLAVRPISSKLLQYLRSTDTPTLLRKALVAWSFLRHSGVFTDFSRGALPYCNALAQTFKPHLVWATFQPSESWIIAQHLAHLCNCPWLADMKDPWDLVIPSLFRSILAKRFNDSAGFTSNSGFNAKFVQSTFSQTASIIYSGVDSCFMGPFPVPQPINFFRITITGSVYDLAALSQFVDALKAWFVSSGELQIYGQHRPQVVYAGADSEKAKSLLLPLSEYSCLRILGYLPLSHLSALCRSSSVNAYIWNRNTFHHKLLELLCCGKPVIAYPGESHESKCLAQALGVSLFAPRSKQELINAFQSLRSIGSPSPTSIGISNPFSWSSQAIILEDVFKLAISHFTGR